MEASDLQAFEKIANGFTTEDLLVGLFRKTASQVGIEIDVVVKAFRPGLD